MSACIATAQNAVASALSYCPRCALGRQVWTEVGKDHPFVNALAIAAPFLTILLLALWVESLPSRHVAGGRKRRARGQAE